MAVKKTPAEKPVARKAAAAKKTTVKAPAKKAAAKKKPAAKVVKKAAVTTIKTTGKTTSDAVKTAATNVGLATDFFTLPLPDFKEMEKLMTTNQPFQFDKMAQEAANQSRESMEAFVKSGTIFAKGFEELMKTAASISQTAAEKQAEFAKQLMGSKTLNEFAEAQNKIAQANFDQFMSGATKLSEMSVKVLSEASEPLNAQATKAMQKANKAMAA